MTDEEIKWTYDRSDHTHRLTTPDGLQLGVLVSQDVVPGKITTVTARGVSGVLEIIKYNSETNEIQTYRQEGPTTHPPSSPEDMKEDVRPELILSNRGYFDRPGLPDYRRGLARLLLEEAENIL